MVSVVSRLEYKMEKLKYKKLKVMQPRIKNNANQLMNKPTWRCPREVLQSWLINTVKWRMMKGRGGVMA